MKTLISIIALICVYVAYKREQAFYSDLKYPLERIDKKKY